MRFSKANLSLSSFFATQVLSRRKRRVKVLAMLSAGSSMTSLCVSTLWTHSLDSRGKAIWTDCRSISNDTRTFVLQRSQRLLSPLLSGVLRAGLDLSLVLTVNDESDKHGCARKSTGQLVSGANMLEPFVTVHSDVVSFDLPARKPSVRMLSAGIWVCVSYARLVGSHRSGTYGTRTEQSRRRREPSRGA